MANSKIFRRTSCLLGDKKQSTKLFFQRKRGNFTYYLRIRARKRTRKISSRYQLSSI